MTRALAKSINKRKGIIALEKAVSKMPGAMHGDCFPLEHSFIDGMYMRKITVPAGIFLIGKAHKNNHPSFLLEGDVSVLTERGVKRLQAPLALITKAGDKRAGYVHKKMVWVDVFKTAVTDLKSIEKECVVKTYEEFDALTTRRISAFAKRIKRD